METRQVKVGDIYADENNPRQDFEGIEELAESFALNHERPGEPFTPPIVMADGGRFRIIDGERRYRAMQQAGTKECTVLVADPEYDDDLLVMLATDDKQPLADTELARGVQQAFAFGIDTSEIARATRVDPERIENAKIGSDYASDDVQYTLEWLEAIAARENAGDFEGAQKVAEADRARFRFVAYDAERKFEKQRAAEAMGSAFGDRLVETEPDGYEFVEEFRTDTDDFMEQVKAFAADHPEAVFVSKVGCIAAYGPDTEEADPNAAEIKRMCLELSAAREHARRVVCAHLEGGGEVTGTLFNEAKANVKHYYGAYAEQAAAYGLTVGLEPALRDLVDIAFDRIDQGFAVWEWKQQKVAESLLGLEEEPQRWLEALDEWYDIADTLQLPFDDTDDRLNAACQRVLYGDRS